MLHDDAMLEGLRRVGDPVPDALVEDLARRGAIESVNDLLRRLTRNDDAIPDGLPAEIAAWLRASRRWPVWADPAWIEQGAEVFAEHGPVISLVLCTAGLVDCYAARRGCQALAFTYRLGQEPYRRIAETAQFVLVVMAPGSLGADGAALPAIQKVRLLHAGIRFLIRQTGRWPEADLGVPLCQEDLLGTLLVFAATPIAHLQTLGFPIGEADAQAYYDRWRVIGELLGVQPDIVPPTWQGGAELAAALRRRHHGPSPEGVRLTGALLHFCAGVIPGEAFDGAIPALIRYLLGDEVAEWMEVPRTGWDWLLRGAPVVGRAAHLVDRAADAAEDAVDRLAMALLRRQAIALSGYTRAGFAIPTTLQARWAGTRYGGE